jgi:hypothetical protein
MTRLPSAVLAAFIICVFAAPAFAQNVAPTRGEAEIGVLTPVTSIETDKTTKVETVVTIIKVKNLMTSASIAGLKVEEYWWDKANNPVTGSKDRLKTPLQPGEVATLTLRTPKDPRMYRNNYVFGHANGKVKTKPMKKFD